MMKGYIRWHTGMFVNVQTTEFALPEGQLGEFVGELMQRGVEIHEVVVL